MVARLAEAFQPMNWSHKETLSLSDDVPNWLEISPEEAELLVKLGLLRSVDNSVTMEDLAAFIEATDWLKLRAANQLRYLRSLIEQHKA
jgi:hypothetical protein